MPATSDSRPPTGSGTPGSSRDDTSSARLLERALRGDHSARDALFARYLPWLRRWARGRLPRWARGVVDTSGELLDPAKAG